MELREIRSFVALAERLHFGETAELLHLSQPGLSKQMQLLEREIGGRLFLRGRKGVQLTEVGRLLLDDARRLARLADQLLDTGRRASLGEIGKLTLGFGFTSLTIVPSAVAVFRRAHPNVEVSLSDISTANQIEALRAGRIQVGLARLPVGEEFRQEQLLEDRLVLVMPAGHRLEDRPSPLRRASNDPFVLLSAQRAPGFHRHVLRLCAKMGFNPRAAQEANEFHTILAFVAAGAGLAFVSESFMRSRPAPAGVVVRPIEDSEARWTIGAIWRRDDTSAMTQEFLRILRRESKNIHT